MQEQAQQYILLCLLNILRTPTIREGVLCLSSSGLGLPIGVLLQTGDLAVGVSHELLEHIVKRLGLLLHRLGRTGTGRPVVLIPGRHGTIAIRAGTVKALLRTVVLRPGRCRLRPANRQINLAVIQTDDHNLYILTLGQMIMNVIDIGMGDF